MVMSLQEGQTVLHLAATAGRTETVEALLDRGCDPNIQDFVSYSLFFASFENI
jgi:ankyrin repeat protein